LINALNKFILIRQDKTRQDNLQEVKITRPKRPKGYRKASLPFGKFILVVFKERRISSEIQHNFLHVWARLGKFAIAWDL